MTSKTPAKAGVFHGLPAFAVTLMHPEHTQLRALNRGDAGAGEGRNHWPVTSSGASHADEYRPNDP
jgi:hypothetical protein